MKAGAEKTSVSSTSKPTTIGCLGNMRASCSTETGSTVAGDSAMEGAEVTVHTGAGLSRTMGRARVAVIGGATLPQPTTINSHRIGPTTRDV